MTTTTTTRATTTPPAAAGRVDRRAIAPAAHAPRAVRPHPRGTRDSRRDGRRW